jgi:CheY-like chemotaxis protein
LDRNGIKETVLKYLVPSEKAVAGGAAGCNCPELLALSRQSSGPSSAPDIVGAKENEEKVVRVLIVEDHWANRRLLETMLRKQGSEFLMEAVENGQEAVHITSARQYDIILMDCNMPIKDGWQATEEIRQMAGPNKMTPIIAVTANAMKGDREKCMAAGMDDYISKPVDRKRLQEVLSKWVSHSVRSGESFN